METYRSGRNELDSKSSCPKGHVGSNPTRCATSEQSPLCSDVFLCLRQKRRHPPAPLLLLSNCDPLARKGYAVSVRRQSRQRLRSRWARSWWAAAVRRYFWHWENIDFNRPFHVAAYVISFAATFFTKVTSHSFCRGSFPNRPRFAGLRFGGPPFGRLLFCPSGVAGFLV